MPPMSVLPCSCLFSNLLLAVVVAVYYFIDEKYLLIAEKKDMQLLNIHIR